MIQGDTIVTIFLCSILVFMIVIMIEDVKGNF